MEVIYILGCRRRRGECCMYLYDVVWYGYLYLRLSIWAFSCECFDFVRFTGLCSGGERLGFAASEGVN